MSRAREGKNLLWMSVLCAIAVCAWPAIAAAQPAAAPSPAQKLFDEGVENMRAGRFEAACPAIAESSRLEPLPGVLFTLAECWAAHGKLATALGEYDRFVQLLTRLPPSERTKHDERRRIALEKMSALSPLVPQITIVVPANAPSTLVVEQDGEVVEATRYGVSLPVDPGSHSIKARAPGYRDFSRVLVTEKSARARIEIELVPLGAPKRQVPRERTAPRSHPDRTWAYVAGGVGVLGVGVGTVAGLVAWGKKDEIHDQCPDRKCTDEGKRAADSAQDMALVSTIGFGVGAAGLALGAILYFTGPGEPEQRPKTGWRPVMSGGLHGAMAGMEGTF